MKRTIGVVLSALVVPLFVSAQEGARSPPNQGSDSSRPIDSGCSAGAVQQDTTGGYGTGASGSCGYQSGSGSSQGVGGQDGTQSGRAGAAMNEGSGDTYGTQPNQGVSADSSQSPSKIDQGANAMGGGVGDFASPNRQPAEGLSTGGAGGMASFLASGGPAGSTQNDYSAGFDSGTALY